MLLAYASSVMRTVPAVSGEGSDFVPTLAAALCACFGQGDAAHGVLPVRIPVVNEQYEITEETLYK